MPQLPPSYTPERFQQAEAMIEKPFSTFYKGITPEIVHPAIDVAGYVADPIASNVEKASNAAARFAQGGDRPEAAADFLEGASGAAIPFLIPPVAKAAWHATWPARAALTAEIGGGALLERGVTSGLRKAGVGEGWSRLGGMATGAIPLVSAGARVGRILRGANAPTPPPPLPDLPDPATAKIRGYQEIPPKMDQPMSMATGSDVPRVTEQVVPLAESPTPSRLFPQKQITAGPGGRPQFELPPPVVPPAATRQAAQAAPTSQQVSMTPEAAVDLGSKFIERSANMPANDAGAVRLREQGENLLKWAESKQGVTDPEQLQFPWRGEGPPSRQGEFWTGTSGTDVPPRARVYSSEPRSPDAASIAAENQVARQQADGIAARPLPEPPGKRVPPEYRPPATKGTRQESLERMGFAPKQVIEPVQTADLQTTDPKVVLSSYPRMKQMSRNILRRTKQDQLMADELSELKKLSPEAGQADRIAEIEAMQQRRTTARLKTGRLMQDEEALVRKVQEIEGAFEPSALKRATAAAGKKPPAREPIIPGGRPPGAAVPPPVPVSDVPPVGEEVVRHPGLTHKIQNPPEVLAKMGGPMEEVGTKLSRGLIRGRRYEADWHQQAIEGGIPQLADNPADARHATRVLENIGGERPRSGEVAKAVKTAKDILNQVRTKVENYKGPIGDRPWMAENPDGSHILWTGKDDYGMHIIPRTEVLRDLNNPVRKESVLSIYERGDAPNLDVADQVVREWVAFKDNAIERPNLHIQYLMKKYPSMSALGAMKSLEKFRTPGSRKAGSLDFVRAVDLPVRSDNLVRNLDMYLSQSGPRIGMAEQIGQKDELVTQAVKRLQRAQKEGISPDKAVEIASKNIDSMLGNKQHVPDENWDNLMGIARGGQSFKISLVTSLLNSMQAANMGLLKTDYPTVFKALAQQVRGEGLERILRSGADVTKAGELARLERSGVAHTGRLGRIRDIISKHNDWYLKNLAQFSRTETAQRQIGFRLGDLWAQKMAKRLQKNPQDVLARRELRTLLLDPDDIAKRVPGPDGKILSEDEMLDAGVSMSDLINFSHRPEGIPVGFQSPGGRTLWQFKTFPMGAYKRTFLDGLKGELADGQVGRFARNLITMATVFGAQGEVIGSIRALIRGGPEALEERQEMEHLDRWVENIFVNGLFGIAYSILEGAIWGKPLEAIAGPTVGSISEASVEAVRAFQDATEGDPDEGMLRLTRLFMRHMPYSATLAYPLLRESINEEMEKARKDRGVPRWQ